MRKRIHFRQLGRTPKHKMAMLRNMVTSLIEHERIVTTTAKAKEVQRLAEKIVTMAKRGTQRAAKVLQNMCTTNVVDTNTNTVTVTDTPGTGSTPTPSTGTTNTTAGTGTLHIDGTTEPSASTSTPDHSSSSSSSNQEKHRYTSAMAPLLHAHRQIGRIVRTDVMVQKVMNVLRHRYDARVGGYTRVLKLSKPRAGDNADMAIIEYVDHSNEVRAARPPDASTTTTKVQPPQLSSIQLQQQLETLRNLYVANKAPRRYLVKNNLVPPPPTE